MKNTKLTLVIPDLLANLAKYSELKLPNLKTLLARADSVAIDQNHLLFNLFSIPINDELPIAALTGLADGLNTQQNYWFRLDPVELRADYAGVYLIGNSNVEFATNVEITAIHKQLKTLLALDNLNFFAPQKKRWYLEVKQNPEIHTSSLNAVIGKDISKFLPVGPKQAYWRKLLTEVQMLMHNFATNSGLDGQKTDVLNGIWLWGEGRLPSPPSTVSWKQVWSNDVLTEGLARLCNIPFLALPHNFAACPAALLGENSLLVMEAVTDPEAIKNLDANWFAALYQALRQKELFSLELYLGLNRVYRVNSRNINYFWRRRYK